MDPAALKIMAGVQGGRGLYCVGYVPRSAIPAIGVLHALSAVEVVDGTTKGLRLRFAV
ncbi:hypothetical protein FACS1894163_05540 [Spirochaetia bacterium]|nr:hypothetical protein FACS1894163_05540 [Spirochaetia bacterium]